MMRPFTDAAGSWALFLLGSWTLSLAGGSSANNVVVPAAPRLLLACEPTNDLLARLPPALKAARYTGAAEAVDAARSGDTVMVLAGGYPSTPTILSAALFAAAKAKGAKLFVEFPAAVPGLTIGSKIEAGNMTFQRLIVATDSFAAGGLAKNRLLYAHGAQWLQAGPYDGGHQKSPPGCHNITLDVKGSTVETTVTGSWGELCGAATPCPIRYTGQLCTTNNPSSSVSSIMWDSMQNMASPAMHWDREHVDSVSKWLGYCGISPTGLALPEHPCTGAYMNTSGVYCGSCPPTPVPPPPPTGSMIQPLLVSARVAGYDTATFGLNGTASTPILFQHPREPSVVIATTKLSSFVRGRFAPVGAWKLLWKELLHMLAPWAGPIELEWEASVHPAFAKNETLPPSAEVEASMTGVEWLRGRSGLLPGPKQLARISELLDPRWVDTGSELSNCSYGECKARLWLAAGGEQGDGRGGILEGYTNLVQADGAQYQVLEFRADCTCESAMAFASYAHTKPFSLAASRASREGGGKEERLNDTDAVAGRLLDHAFSVGGFQEGAAINGALADGATGFLHWTMGGSNPGGKDSLWGDDNARALLGAMTAGGLLNDSRWSTEIARAILGNLRAVGVDGFRPVAVNRAQLIGQGATRYGAVNLSGWQDFHSANWSAIEGDSYKDWAFSPHMESYLWAVFLRAYDLTNDEAFLERALTPITTMMSAYPAWAPIANGVQLQKARMLLPLAWLVRVRDTPLHRGWLSRVADDLLRSQQPCGAIREQICDVGWRCTDTSNTPTSNQAYGHGEAPLQQTNTDPVTDALYTINFAALGLREAVAATGNATLAAAETLLSQYLIRIQQRSKARPELDGAWMRAFDYEKWEVWASASDIGWGPWCVETGWMNSWIITMLSFRSRNTSVWETTASEPFAGSLREEIVGWKPYFFKSDDSESSTPPPSFSSWKLPPPPPGFADGRAVQVSISTAIARGADEYTFPAAGDVWFGNQSLEVVEGQGLTLRGSAAKPTTLWFSLGGGVQLLRCHNVTLESISIDYAPVPYLQATIVGSVSINSSFTVYDFELFNRSSPLGSRAASGAGHLWRAGGVVRPGDVPTIVPPLSRATNIAGTRVFQSLMATIPGARVGDLVTYSGTYYWTLAISNSSGVVVEDVSIFSASGMAIVELDGACGHQYRRVRVVPRDGYMIASNRDILHSADCGYGPLVEHCVFSRGCDDYINIHTTIQTLHHSASKGLMLISPRIVTTDPGPGNFTDRWYGTTAPLTNVDAGDTIECFDPTRQFTAPHTRHGTFVLASKPREIDLASDPALKVEVLGLPAALNGPRGNASPPLMPWTGARAWGVAFGGGATGRLPQLGESWQCDISRFSARGAILRNNTFMSPIWSGVRFKSPGGLIEGNHFVSSGMLAIGTGALQDWQEGPIAQRNVTVIANSFENCTADHGGDNFVSPDPRVSSMRVSDNRIRDSCGVREAPSYNSDEQCVALPLSVQYVPLPPGPSPSTPCELLQLSEGPSGLRAELVAGSAAAAATMPRVVEGGAHNNTTGCWNFSTFEGSVGVCQWQNMLARGALLVCLGPNQPTVRVLCRGKLLAGALVTAARALVVPVSGCT